METVCRCCRSTIKLYYSDIVQNEYYLGEFNSWKWHCPDCGTVNIIFRNALIPEWKWD